MACGIRSLPSTRFSASSWPSRLTSCSLLPPLIDHIAKLNAASVAAAAAKKITELGSGGTVKIGKPSNLTAQADTNPAAHYIYVQSSGIVTHDDGSLTNSAETPMTLAGTDITNDPQLGFTLDGSSGKGKITLTHYVWVTPTDMEADPWWAKSSPVSLTMTVTSVK